MALRLTFSKLWSTGSRDVDYFSQQFNVTASCPICRINLLFFMNTSIKSGKCLEIWASVLRTKLKHETVKIFPVAWRPSVYFLCYLSSLQSAAPDFICSAEKHQTEINRNMQVPLNRNTLFVFITGFNGWKTFILTLDKTKHFHWNWKISDDMYCKN